MDISTKNNLISLPRTYESSNLRSPRDKDSLYTVWKKVNEIVQSVNSLNQFGSQISREIQRIEGHNSFGLDFYPFKIYQLNNTFRIFPDNQYYTSSYSWCTVRVRGGYVFTNQVSSGSYVNYTDGCQTHAYDNTFPLQYGPYDIQLSPIPSSSLSSGSLYYLWIENGNNSTGSNYSVRWSTNPTIASVNNPNPWTSFPSADANHIPIGTVDTNTSQSSQVAIIRQYLDSDVLVSGGGGNYYFYDESASYSKGDMVRVECNNSYTMSLYTTQSNGGPTLCAGTFYVNEDVPALLSSSVSSSRDNSAWWYPYYPLIPSSSQVIISGSNTIYNRNIFLPISPMLTSSLCDSENNTIIGFVDMQIPGLVYSANLPYTGSGG